MISRERAFPSGDSFVPVWNDTERVEPLHVGHEMPMSTPPSVGVVTLAKNRREHLSRQRVAIAGQTVRPDAYVVVDLGGESVDPGSGGEVRLLSMPVDGPLPLAAARNAGARAVGTDIIVFLDVDCVPEPTLIADYRAASVRHRALWCGPVGYLPPLDSHDYWYPNGELASDDLRRRARYQPGRPQPDDPPSRSDRFDLLWSLSFATDRHTWERIGGFDEQYVGYGAEDTDLALTARSAGVELRFTGAAGAFHQHHPVSSPPTEHLHDIGRNALRFHEKWGTWPMGGWLTEFAREGLIDWTPEGDRLVVRTVR